MKVTFRLNRKGFYNLRRDPAVVADLEARAQRVAEAATAGAHAAGKTKARYEVGSRQGARKPQGRWRTTVITANAEAMVDNAAYNRLLKSIDRGR